MGVFLISVLLYKHHHFFFAKGSIPPKRGSSKNLFIRYSYHLSLILTKRIDVTRHARNSIYSQQTTHRQCVGWVSHETSLCNFGSGKRVNPRAIKKPLTDPFDLFGGIFRDFLTFLKRVMSKKVRQHRAFPWLALLYNHHHHRCQ